MVAPWLLIVLACVAYYIYSFYKKVAKYPPGPMPLPLIGNLHQIEAINTHKYFERLSKTYGPVFTLFFPAPTVIITQLAEVREALIKKGDIFTDRPSGPLNDILMCSENGGVLFASGANWREQRRFAIHTLRDFGMGRNIMEEKVLSSVMTMFEQLDEKLTSNAFDMNWPLQLCIGNIINDLLLGYHWQADDCDKFIEFKEGLERLLRLMRERKSVMLVQSYPWLKNVPIIGYMGYYELREDINKIFAFMKSEVEVRKKQLDYDSEPTDFVGAYLQELRRRKNAGDNDDSYSEINMLNSLSDFWIAGMETTATTLRWAILLLVTYPEVQEKLQKEVDSIVGRDRQPTMADKMNMPYASAVIMELQRKSNIVTYNAPRCPSTDAEIGGHIIPARTVVFAQITTVMDNPLVFPHPERFDPDRFLESDGKTFNKTAMDNLVPFSLGKRQCAGEPLARMELFLILVSLIQRYTFAVPEGMPPPDLTPIFGATQTPIPYECKVTLRA